MSRFVDRLISPLVPISFGAAGLAARRPEFAPLPWMNGKHVVVTGANSGIGRATCELLAARGARVTMVCRDRQRAEVARAMVVAVAPIPGLIDVELCDVANLDDVAALTSRLFDPVDVLVHNAGVLPDHRIDTPDGLELTWATHVAGPHLLTRLTQRRMSPGGRVIWVSSGGMYMVPLLAPATVPSPYDGVRAYALTKRAQVVLAELWAEFFPGGAQSVSMHPGWADTDSVKRSLPRFHRITKSLLRDPAGGADTINWLASEPSDHVHNGGFYFDRQLRATHLLPWQHDNRERREALWTWCEQLSAQYFQQHP